MENRNNDELELTELQQAERVARRWSDLSSVPSSYAEARLLARVFLAQQARLAKVERELDACNARRHELAARLHDTKASLAAARFCAELAAAERERDREYPAPTEREGARTHCGCWADRAPNEPCVCPTPPQAAPEPLYLVVEYQGPLGDWRGDAYRTRVRLTPEDCRRIVETGRASGRGE